MTSFRECTIYTVEDVIPGEFVCTIVNSAGRWFYMRGEFSSHNRALDHAKAFLSGQIGLPWYLWQGKEPCA